MFIILVTNDHKLLPVYKERIIQCSKNVHTLCFIADKVCDGVDISDCNVKFQYTLPDSNEYHSEELVLSEELYDNKMLMYKTSIDERLTMEVGDVKVKLTFSKTYVDENDDEKNYLRITEPTKFTVEPNSFDDGISEDETGRTFYPISEEFILSLFD